MLTNNWEQVARAVEILEGRRAPDVPEMKAAGLTEPPEDRLEGSSSGDLPQRLADLEGFNWD